MQRIAIIDGDRRSLQSVQAALEAQDFKVDTYNDGRTAFNAIIRDEPDMVIMEVKLPGMDGLDVLEKLREKTNIPVMILTDKTDEIDEILGLRMGADDYVKKPCPHRVMIERIRVLVRHTEAIHKAQSCTGEAGEAPIIRGKLEMNPQRHEVSWNGNMTFLTVTEFDLLWSLALQPGFVKSRDQLMDIAYGNDVHVDFRTIDSHIKRLRAKMRKADPDFKAIETLYGIGYRFNLE